VTFRFYKGWAEEEGRKAGERERAERGAKAKPLLSERQQLMASRRAYEENQASKAEGYGVHPVTKAADQWLKDARAAGETAGEAFAGLFDRGVN
jgi:hypothetical protein